MIFEKERYSFLCKIYWWRRCSYASEKAAISLLELKDNKESLTEEISELCKSFDAASLPKKKMSSSAIAKCISEGIDKEELSALKEIFKSL